MVLKRWRFDSAISDKFPWELRLEATCLRMIQNTRKNWVMNSTLAEIYRAKYGTVRFVLASMDAKFASGRAHEMIVAAMG